MIDDYIEFVNEIPKGKTQYSQELHRLVQRFLRADRPFCRVKKERFPYERDTYRDLKHLSWTALYEDKLGVVQRGKEIYLINLEIEAENDSLWL